MSMRHFLSIADYNTEELKTLINLAIELKQELKSTGSNLPELSNKVLAMVFQKPSLRTRVSFDMAMRQLGGDALYLSPNEIGLGKRESIADVSRVLSGYVDGIMARVFDHEHILQLAEHAAVPVINGLSDFNHPCQAMADVLTFYEEFKTYDGLKLTFVGDGNNVAVSLLFSAVKFGFNITIATPEGYTLSADTIKQAQAMNEMNVDITQSNDPKEAVKDAHIIYTDTWVSMGQEEEQKKREAVFPPFQVNRKLVEIADKDAIVLHCLPAHRGQEITDEVADGPQSRIFEQAENRMHAQKAVLLNLLRE
jgi:ornithine carbamoyltransferase